jgi:hypothetical protein
VAAVEEGEDPMDAGLLAVLNEGERLLVEETEPAALDELDEDGVVALHTRVRRARGKYVGQYRRSAAARVPEQGGRGLARPKNTRSRQKAEVFEAALARVSRRLAALADEAAEQLKAERLAMAQAANSGRGPDGGDGAEPGSRRRSVTTGPSGDRALRSPASEKRRADTQAVGARRQARRDAR